MKRTKPTVRLLPLSPCRYNHGGATKDAALPPCPRVVCRAAALPCPQRTLTPGKTMDARLSLLAVPALIAAACSTSSTSAGGGASTTPSALTPAEARAIAKEAVTYGFPLVDSYRVQHSYFVDRSHPEFKATWNTLVHTARVYTPDDKAIQTPNSDTPYSFFGADLRAEPVVISVPAVEKSRYYSLQFIDQYTFNFAYVGSRATGNDAGTFLLAGPQWQGQAPAGIKSVLRSETEFAFVLIRTQLLGPDDLDHVKKIQAGYRLQPLSQFVGHGAPAPATAAAAAAIDFPQPLTPADERTSLDFFRILDFVLRSCPTHPAEVELRARFARLGVAGHGDFDAKAMSPEIAAAVRAGMADAWIAFQEFKTTQLDTGKRSSADAFGTRDYLKGSWIDRMAGAVLGIYGNSKEEAIYPAYFVDDANQPLQGTNRYALRFGPDQLPPVNAFWSLTLYELPSSLLYANPLRRYLINSPMLPSLKCDADGGLTIRVQHDRPGAEQESNWLPAPAGPFILAMRLYWPKPEALSGAWRAPRLNRVGAAMPVDASAGALSAEAAGDAVPVTIDNFARAESDMYFAAMVKENGLGQLNHRREPAPIEHQTVIRLNRDTLYSSAVFDLEAGPVTITLPDAGKRFMSLQVVNEDHYVPMVVYDAGPHTLDKATVGTRYASIAIRTLVDPKDPADVAQVRALQDAIVVEQPGGVGEFDIPRWDPFGQKKVRDALLALGTTMPDFRKAFGTKETVDPVHHLVGTALGWGGNPDKDAIYLNVTPAHNDGTSVYRLVVRDVPVDAFWSVSVYNAEGYFEANAQNAYTLNSITAHRGSDGSITVQFGGCDGKVDNCLPIVQGWNYTVRLYRPRPELLSGQWTFPQPELVQ